MVIFTTATVFDFTSLPRSFILQRDDPPEPARVRGLPETAQMLSRKILAEHTFGWLSPPTLRLEER